MKEQELKLAQALEENAALKQVYNQKLAEKDNVNYKSSKAKSQFFEIMTELCRFRQDFGECHSMRSKFIQLKQVSLDIDHLNETNDEILQKDKNKLKSFQDQKDFI